MWSRRAWLKRSGLAMASVAVGSLIPAKATERKLERQEGARTIGPVTLSYRGGYELQSTEFMNCGTLTVT
jgi:hypothetical protein